jgi:hypothetical protein
MMNAEMIRRPTGQGSGRLDGQAQDFAVSGKRIQDSNAILRFGGAPGK